MPIQTSAMKKLPTFRALFSFLFSVTRTHVGLQIELVFQEGEDDDVNLDEMDNESSEISYLDNKVCNL